MMRSITTEYAIRAWTRRQSGAWTGADELELQGWLHAAPEHQAAYDKVARVWTETGALRDRFPRRNLRPGSRSNSRAVIAIAGVAAAIAVLAVAVWPVGSRWWYGEPQRWSAAPDKPTSVILSDGTHILLDAGSEIEARIGARVRHVSLRRGEVLLTVAHERWRAFELESGSGRVTDLGTRFDVEIVGGTTRVTVLEGRVGVWASGREVALTGGQAGGYDRDGAMLPVTASGATEMLWAAGKRHFDREPLSDVLERLGRYHGVSFVFPEAQLRQLQLSGTFRVDDLSLFLRTLAAALPVEAQEVGPQRFEVRSRANR